METKNFNYVNAQVLALVEKISHLLKKGASTNVVIAKSCDDDMNKGRAAFKNPFLGRVTKIEKYSGWQVGTSYENACQNATARSGSNEIFKTQPNWHTYFNPFFQTDKATKTKFYLQLQKSVGGIASKLESVIYLDGEEVCHKVNGKVVNNAPAWNEIEPWFKVKNHTQSESQIQAGVTAENERKYILISLTNIKEIKQKDRIVRVAEELSEVPAQSR